MKHQIIAGSLLRKALRDIAIYFPGKLLPAATAFITVPIFARLFEPEEYGVLSLVVMFISAGGIVVGTWLNSSTMRFLPHYRRKSLLGRFYITLLVAFTLSVIAMIMLGVPVYLISKDTVSPEVYRLLPMAGIIIVLSSLFSVLQTIYRSDQRPKPFVGFELFQVYGALIIGLSLVAFVGFGVEGILLGNLVAAAVASLASIWLLVKHYDGQIGVGSFSRVTLLELASYGLPGGVATIGAWVLAFSDRYIIEVFRGSAEVGLYSMGYGIADKSIRLVGTSLILAIGPLLINTWESERRTQTADLLRQMTRLMLLLLIPMAAGLSVLAVPIVQILTTDAYLPSATVLPWVAFGAVFYALKDLAYTGLVLSKKPVAIARNTLVAAMANVVLNIVFVPRFGFIAAAVNTAITYAVVLALNTISANRYLPWLFPWRTLRNVLIAVGVMVTTIWFGKRLIGEPRISTLLISVLIGVGVYGGMLFILQEFTREERKSLNSLTGQVYNLIKSRLRVKSIGGEA